MKLHNGIVTNQTGEHCLPLNLNGRWLWVTYELGWGWVTIYEVREVYGDVLAWLNYPDHPMYEKGTRGHIEREDYVLGRVCEAMIELGYVERWFATKHGRHLNNWRHLKKRWQRMRNVEPEWFGFYGSLVDTLQRPGRVCTCMRGIRNFGCPVHGQKNKMEHALEEQRKTRRRSILTRMMRFVLSLN